MGRRLVRRSQCASWGSGKSEVGFSEGAGENGRKSAFRGTSCQDRGQHAPKHPPCRVSEASRQSYPARGDCYSSHFSPLASRQPMSSLKSFFAASGQKPFTLRYIVTPCTARRRRFTRSTSTTSKPARSTGRNTSPAPLPSSGRKNNSAPTKPAPKLKSPTASHPPTRTSASCFSSPT